jgi:hypothetical protein
VLLLSGLEAAPYLKGNYDFNGFTPYNGRTSIRVGAFQAIF